MSKIRIIKSADLPDPTDLPDPVTLQQRWSLWGVPDYVIHRHVEHIVNTRYLKIERKAFKPKEDLTGKQFGQLTVIRFYEKDSKNNYRWLCRCSCGSFTRVSRTDLVTGHSARCRSCADKLRNVNRIKAPRDQVAQLLRSGLTRTAIAKKFDCSVSLISARAKELGL